MNFHSRSRFPVIVFYRPRASANTQLFHSTVRRSFGGPMLHFARAWSPGVTAPTLSKLGALSSDVGRSLSEKKSKMRSH